MDANGELKDLIAEGHEVVFEIAQVSLIEYTKYSILHMSI